MTMLPGMKALSVTISHRLTRAAASAASSVIPPSRGVRGDGLVHEKTASDGKAPGTKPVRNGCWESVFMDILGTPQIVEQYTILRERWPACEAYTTGFLFLAEPRCSMP